MTLEKQCAKVISIATALEFDAVSWEALSDDDIKKIFESSLCVTRPEYARRTTATQSALPYITPEKRETFDKVKEATGMDLGMMMKQLGIKGKKK